MNSPPKRVFRLAHKELREILRDRRTIVTLVAMPLLLYPLMSVVFLQFSLLNRETPAEFGPRYVIAALSNGEEFVFLQRLNRGEAAIERRRLRQGNKKSPPTPEFLPYLDGPRPKTDEERTKTLERLEIALREKAIDLIVRIPGAESPGLIEKTPAEDRAFECKLIAVSNSTRAQSAIAYVEEMFAAVNEADLKARLGVPDAKVRVNLLHPERIVLTAPSEEPFAALVPLILILLTITGAVYPAIDLTAGERERGTLEILVAAPVSRFELLSAKYISVMTVAMMTAVVNLICMAITVTFTGLLGDRHLSPLLLVEGLGLLVLFAAFFSAVLLCVTSFARSFKEAQAYLIPLMLGSLTPGVVAMMPGLKLEGTLAALPLVNIVLMARDLLEGGVDPGIAVIVIVTTLLYAVAALALAARVFGEESVLYSEQSSWADLLRRPSEPQPAASIPAMLWCLALMVPIFFATNGLLRLFVSDPAQEIILMVVLNVIVTVIMFAGLPGLFAYLGRVDLEIGLGMRVRDRLALGLGLAAGLILGLSLWPIELWLLSQSDIHNVLQERFSAVLQNIRQAHERLGWFVLITVIVPAVLEEFFFRGLLFQALRRKTGAFVTIGTSAGLFALTHVVLGGPLGMERLMPSLLLGLILSTVCWVSDSVWPSVVLHVCHNTILMIVGMGVLGPKDEVPWEWRIAGMAGVVIGGGLVGLLFVRQRGGEPGRGERLG